MSLVGRELEVTVGKDLELEVTVPNTVATTSTDDSEEASSTLVGYQEDTNHPPLSPAGGAEALFLPGLGNSSISANALATELRKNHRPPFQFLLSPSSVATDDYVSAFNDMDDPHYKEAPTTTTSTLSRQTIYEFEEDPKAMSSSTPTSSSPSEEINVNAAEQVYGAAKNVWGWGKEQMVISTFLGITEAIAGKVVGVVGTDLEEIDGNIKPKLNELDSSIINPAVRAILGIVMKAAGKSEDIFKPIVVSILKPIGLIKSDKDSVAPELTETRTTTVS